VESHRVKEIVLFQKRYQRASTLPDRIPVPRQSSLRAAEGRAVLVLRISVIPAPKEDGTPTRVPSGGWCGPASRVIYANLRTIFPSASCRIRSISS